MMIVGVVVEEVKEVVVEVVMVVMVAFRRPLEPSKDTCYSSPWDQDKD